MGVGLVRSASVGRPMWPGVWCRCRSYLIPEVIGLRAERFRDVARFDPAVVELVVEVESPSSVSTDRMSKAAKYAEAGIGHYWRVESDPVRLTAYVLPDVGETAGLSAPFPASVEVGRLQPPRR